MWKLTLGYSISTVEQFFLIFQLVKGQVLDPRPVVPKNHKPCFDHFNKGSKNQKKGRQCSQSS
jgi:hypothetical protein